MSHYNVIAGITGTHGSGKGTIVSFLMQFGFEHHSVRELLWKEVDAADLPRDRESARIMANTLRSQHGPEILIKRLYEQSRKRTAPVVIESIYTMAEIEFLKKVAQDTGQRFVLIAVDADRQIRYERISLQRKSETDRVTFRQFCEHEEREMHSSNPVHQSLLACRSQAHITLDNSGSREEFEAMMNYALLRVIMGNERATA